MSTQTPRPKPKAIIFDLLTALIDSWSLWDACASTPGLGRAWRKKYLELTFSCGAYQPYEDMVHQAALLTPGLPEGAADQLSQSWDQLNSWPECAGVLQSLQEQGYKLAVITNCSVELGRRAAARVGVDFDVVLTAEEVGFYKPTPQAYAAPIKALGLQPEECLFVAGSAGDVVGATKAGMRVVWHNRVGLEAKRGEDGEIVMPEREGRELGVLLRGVGVLL